GEIESLRDKARERIAELHGRGMTDATFYDASDSSVRGTHAMFIVRGDPRSYNLPPKPEVPTIYLKKGWTSSAIGSGLLLARNLRGPGKFRFIFSWEARLELPPWSARSQTTPVPIAAWCAMRVGSQPPAR